MANSQNQVSNDFAIIEEMEWRRNQMLQVEEMEWQRNHPSFELDEEGNHRLIFNHQIDYENDEDFAMIDFYRDMIDFNVDEDDDETDDGYISTENNEDEKDVINYNFTCRMLEDLYIELIIEELTNFRYLRFDLFLNYFVFKLENTSDIEEIERLKFLLSLCPC